MNLSYEVTHDELRSLFSKYGEVKNIEVPLRKGGGGQALGIAYITFDQTEGAISAYASLDKQYYQGRKLHIMPAQKKPPAEPREFKPREDWDKDKKNSDSQFKNEKAKTLKLNFDDETNWNYLFMNQDTVATSMAKKLGMEKSELMQSDNIAVKMAHAETIIINQTKEWMKENGMDIDVLEKHPRSKCERSKTTLLVKNIPYTTKDRDLRNIFERYGELERLLISPFNTVAIVEYKQENQCQLAAKNLAYYMINFIMPIYLEFAPIGLLSDDQKVVEDEPANETGLDVQENREKTVFIKNLNFKTSETQLEEIFKSIGAKVLSVRIVRKSDTQ